MYKIKFQDGSEKEFESLSRANLSEADLSEADLRGANLSRANLSRADLSEADLSEANLSEANLSRVYLSRANLSRANLSEANLSEAYLREADLRGANLCETNLSEADLIYADLCDTNLSGGKGLLTVKEFMSKFEKDEFGYIVYKKIGNTDYSIPKHWIIEPGSFLEEVINPSRTIECGCGVNFGTLEWCRTSYPNANLWKCRIRFEDLGDVCVPYNTDGKARCARLELLYKC